MADAISISDVGIRFSINRRRRLRMRDLFVSRGRVLSEQSFWALRHVSFNVAPGEAVALVGRNGSGKSTLLRLVAGVMIPDEGEIQVTGGVGAMLELSAGFNGDLSARDNVYLLGALHGFSREQIDERFDDIVRWAEVARFVDTPMRHFSSGMRARLAFSVVTRMEEPIVLVDEVMAVGDKAFRRKCETVMANLLSEGRTLLLVSHNDADLRRFCSRGIYLDQGQMIDDGPLEEILARYGADSDREQ